MRKQSLLKQEGEQSSRQGEGPNHQHGLCLGEATTDEAMREVVGIPHIKRFAGFPAETNNPGEINQGDGQDQERA